jgi:hypothetical protein
MGLNKKVSFQLKDGKSDAVIQINHPESGQFVDLQYGLVEAELKFKILLLSSEKNNLEKEWIRKIANSNSQVVVMHTKDPINNIDRIKELTQEAKKEGLQVVLFVRPENPSYLPDSYSVFDSSENLLKEIDKIGTIGNVVNKMNSMRDSSNNTTKPKLQ